MVDTEVLTNNLVSRASTTRKEVHMRHGRPFKKLTESDVRVRLGSFGIKQVGALHDPHEEWEVNKKKLPGACFCTP